MAIARTSSLVGAISGSVDSITFANTRQGLLIKHRPRKVNQRTYHQTISRAAFSLCVRDWNDLIPVVRAQWTVLAQNTPITNRLGQTSHPSPWQLWIAKNLHAAFWVGRTYATPQIVTVPYFIGEITVAFTEGGPFNITFDDCEPAVGYFVATCARTFGGYSTFTPANRKDIYIVQDSPPYLPVRTFFARGNPSDIHDAFVACLGEPVAGEFIHVSVHQLTYVGMWPSNSVAAQTVVA